MALLEFLHALVAYLAANGVLPPEVTPNDTDRSKTYLVYLPDAPDKAYCVKIYDGSVPSLADKQAGVFRVQVVMRNPSHAEVLSEIYTLWRFLLQLSSSGDYITDISADYWAIIDPQSPPIAAGRDEKGNYLYTLNFPVTTKMF